MSDLVSTLSTLKRPRILVGAARKGVGFYRRERDLEPLLKSLRSPADADSEQLLAAEAQLEQTRSNGGSGYSLTNHIAVLTALIAEAALSHRQA